MTKILNVSGIWFLELGACLLFGAWTLVLEAKREVRAVCAREFPHSEIPGSKVATHLPEAYRRYAASFIASLSHEASTMCPYVTCTLLPALSEAF